MKHRDPLGLPSGIRIQGIPPRCVTTWGDKHRCTRAADHPWGHTCSCGGGHGIFEDVVGLPAQLPPEAFTAPPPELPPLPSAMWPMVWTGKERVPDGDVA